MSDQVQADQAPTDENKDKDKAKVATVDQGTMSQCTFVRSEHKFQRLKEEVSGA